VKNSKYRVHKVVNFERLKSHGGQFRTAFLPFVTDKMCIYDAFNYTNLYNKVIEGVGKSKMNKIWDHNNKSLLKSINIVIHFNETNS